MSVKPKAYDLYCGLGGWAEGFLAEGYEVVGFDIEAHDYGTGGYPGELILRDVRSIRGEEVKDATVLVASPPCQEPSYRAMPWSRAKALNAIGPPHNFIDLFNQCFRIQREACEAAGHYIPLIVENVCGAQKWVGRSRWHYGSFYLWGDVPALMPIVLKREVMKRGVAHRGDGVTNFHGCKTTGHVNKRDEYSHTRHLTSQRESEAVKVGGIDFNDRAVGFNVEAAKRYREGVKQAGISGPRENGKGDRWFQDGAARHGSRSNSRKAAAAMIAKIPFALSSHIARCFKVPA